MYDAGYLQGKSDQEQGLPYLCQPSWSHEYKQGYADGYASHALGCRQMQG